MQTVQSGVEYTPPPSEPVIHLAPEAQSQRLFGPCSPRNREPSALREPVRSSYTLRSFTSHYPPQQAGILEPATYGHVPPDSLTTEEYEPPSDEPRGTPGVYRPYLQYPHTKIDSHVVFRKEIILLALNIEPRCWSCTLVARLDQVYGTHPHVMVSLSLCVCLTTLFFFVTAF